MDLQNLAMRLLSLFLRGVADHTFRLGLLLLFLFDHEVLRAVSRFALSLRVSIEVSRTSRFTEIGAGLRQFKADAYENRPNFPGNSLHLRVRALVLHELCLPLVHFR